ncbi:thiamine pyrophosphate-binding protein [Blastococcus sp. BMG 814]|uniref:Thiamine pyrophosphate-binding protein n=1 Tax=Blastococcus carthaginiensis TaxID=3050034 RepID=A0ABT9IA97_9ACTN|nr:thiamine pyrophosphate-binding protein [Blastococcus carthaginiensis]MDP5182497.1 thiamine pyrophosphate-binding protein [Blastococcus carthaginiensis]
MRVHQAVARSLRENEVSRVFGVLGDANMQYIAHFIEHGGEFVNAVHEGGAVSMADGFARASGAASVASVTHGPGMTNALTALTEAVRARSPVLLLTADTPLRRDFVQQVDLRAAALVCGAEYRAVLTPDHVADDIAKALQRVAVTGVPIVLDIAHQLLNREVDYVPSRFGRRPADRVVPNEEALDEALGVLASASRPLILGGVGAVAAGAHEELVALARQVGAPLATTLLAKDFFREDPFDLGFFGTLSHPPALDTIQAADCVVAFGASLNHYTTAEGSLLAGAAVIHCDIRPGAIGRYSAVDVGLVGDAALTARLMREQLESADLPPRTWCDSALRTRLDAQAPAHDYVDAGTETTMDPRTAVVELDRLLPASRTVVTDVGRFMRGPWLYLHVAEPGSFHHTVNFGSIGLGLATAVGAAFAHGDRPTIAVVGDGGAMMGLMEFTTAVRGAVPLVVVILNDDCYGAEYTKLKDAGLDPKYSLIAWPEFADLAQSMGGHGVTVRNQQDLVRAADMVTRGLFPLLIDVKTDPTVDIGILG